jgi:Gas vesicle synthesis protein GvpL/GvpF
MIYLYGICDRPETPLPRRRGLAQAPLDAIVEGPLVAAITRHSHPPNEPAVDALWIHERVVDRLMAEHTVLPMRFGSKLDDDRQVQQLLRERRQGFVAALDHVRGRVELGVRVLRTGGAADGADAPAVSAPAAAVTGRDYLLGKLRNGQQADGAARSLHEPLADLAVESRRHPSRAPEEILRASYLVDLPVVARFRSVVERLQRTQPEAAILCTGPWPPYSFVSSTNARPADAGSIAIGG